MILSTFIWVLPILQIAEGTVLGFNRRVETALHPALHRRQVPNVPTACKSSCDPVNTLINANCTPSQCCTTQFETNYFNCFLCVAAAANVTDFSSAQNVLNLLVQQCAANGFSIPMLTLPTDGSHGTSLASGTSASSSTSTQSSSSGISQNTVTSVSATAPLFPQTTISVLPSTTELPGTSANTSPSQTASNGSVALLSNKALGVVLCVLMGMLGFLL
ncbi:hypothetical protein BDQ12DRAFT_164348 [Crucibulum laeve]|uniref:Extracellular membrane protein CFEM domain-containing protein n=1 Tax=Crucibulum laeve TaxID=68775 RepID=A0A5C3MCN2_9AGAR|nr:hypothetical protein BDQ12DRAFT_164348 [Crucibulum laeve]